MIQEPDVAQWQLALDSLENILLFLGLGLALLIMILIPILLCFGMFDHYFALQKYKSTIDRDICAESADHSEHIKHTCHKYLKSYASFIQYTLGLVAWNTFSLVYIALAFPDFKSGLISYFYFPFEVIKSMDQQNMLSSFTNFDMSWIYMLSIGLISFLFFVYGKNLGNYFGKNSIKNKELQPTQAEII